MKSATPAAQLEGFMKKFTPEIQRLAKDVLRTMRKLVPGATELVYDNYNALVIGFGPSEHASEAMLSIALYPRWINLFFLQGARLADPRGVLKGSGKIVRNIVVKDVSELDDPYVRKLIAAALKQGSPPIDKAARRRLVVRAVSPKQRARRPEER